MIYVDNAATTMLDKESYNAMKSYLEEEYANASQPYTFSRTSKKALKEAREIIASCINAQPEEIYFTSGGTECDNWAIKGTVFSYNEKKETVTTHIEHHALLKSCKAIERLGFPVSYLLPSREGVITTENLKSYISNKVGLVSIMFANNEIGTIQPIKELCEIAREYGALFHTDAVQAVGHINVDVKDLKIDMLSASGHKFNGPKGVGFMYIRNGTKISSLIEGGMQEKGKRAGTENIAAIIGMAIALKNNYNNLYSNMRHIHRLEELFIKRMKENNIMFIQNGGDYHLPGLLSISFENMQGESILHRMDLMGICVSTGSACDSENTKISHVLKAIKLDDRLAKGTIRVSIGKKNTEEEIVYIVNALAKIINF